MSNNLILDVSQNGPVENGNARGLDAQFAIAELEDCHLSRLLDRPRTLNIERQRSCDQSELSIGMSPRRGDIFDYVFSPGRRSGFNTPRVENGFETHPMIAEAWEALRRSLVYFRGQPVGTIAALDNSEEKLNYDQVTEPEMHLNLWCFLRALFPLIETYTHCSATNYLVKDSELCLLWIKE